LQRFRTNALIVDDDPVIRALLSFVLQKHGFSVHAVGHPHDALALFETQSFDVLFTDLRLPEMSGLMLAAETRARFPQIPIVLMTATREPELEDRLQLINVNHKLTKPFSLTDVENVLEQLVKKKGQAGAN
jgi:CheY-like chemotaxis protein